MAAITLVRKDEKLHCALRWGGAFLMPIAGFAIVEALSFNNILTSFSAMQVLLNFVWYYMILGAIYLAVGRVKLSAGLALGLYFLLGMANHYIIRFRGRTIFPSDLASIGTAASVAGTYDYRLDAVQIQCLVAVIILLVALFFLPKDTKGRKKFRPKIVLPCIGASALFLIIFFQTSFLSVAGIKPPTWTTRENGFLLGFTVSLRYSRIEKPANYTAETLSGITDAVSEAAVPASGGAAVVTQPTNVIVIMNESFSDFAALYDLPTNEDPLPFIHSLSENTISGTAHASSFGGGTANSEYEFLTGNSMSFLPTDSVPYHLYVKPGSASLVGQMNALGYESVAMHPYLPSGWNRVPVYQDFGFSKSLFAKDFTDCSYMRDYITDLGDYQNMVRLFEEKEADSPLFVFNITMQNHSSYSVPWGSLPKTVWLTDELEGKFGTVDQYLSLLKQSDLAFEWLISYFAAQEEPTMILMFGDHQPQVATNFYTSELGGNFADIPPRLQQARQKVPFIMWANYDIPEAQNINTSLNYLSTLLTKTANLPQTGYQQFLQCIQQDLPVVNAVGFRGADGVWRTDKAEADAATQKALLAYEQMQYNNLFDHSRLKDFFTLPEPPAAAPS